MLTNIWYDLFHQQNIFHKSFLSVTCNPSPPAVTGRKAVINHHPVESLSIFRLFVNPQRLGIILPPFFGDGPLLSSTACYE